MELAIVKRYFVRSSTPYIPRLARAVHGNAQPAENKDDKKCTTSIPILMTSKAARIKK